MNDADIIKALQLCFTLGRCEDCPLYADGLFSQSRNACRAKLMGDALDLINRQKAEIERLNTNMDAMVSEHKRLIVNVRTEVIKEFAKRLKEEGHVQLPPIGYPIDTSDFVIYPEDIDNLVKEMTEK